MRSLPLMVLFALVAGAASAQEPDFQKLIAQTNEYLKRYDEASPWGMVSFSQLGLKKKEIQQLISETDYDSQLSAGKDSIDGSIVIGHYQEEIINNLHQIIKHPDFLKNDITQLLDRDAINMVKSADNKLFSFFFDEKTGGSYLSQISIVYFTGLSEPSISEDDEGTSDAYAAFPKDGFGSIDTINTQEGTKYLLQGGVRGCHTCFGENITLVKFENNTFVQEFEYSISSRSYDGIISYDPETKTISISYETDDMTGDCSCGGARDTEYFEEGKKCECRFEFNGLDFELVEATFEITR